MMDAPNWNILASFDDPSGLKSSDIQKDIDENMYLRNKGVCETKEFACKYIKKLGWFKCKRLYKIIYMRTSMKIRVWYNSEDPHV